MADFESLLGMMEQIAKIEDNQERLEANMND
jgi:hypothetical protein